MQISERIINVFSAVTQRNMTLNELRGKNLIEMFGLNSVDALEVLIRIEGEFGIQIDEGIIGPDYADVGSYGPYTQSERGAIYQTYAKDLIARGLAYPCFLSEEEMKVIREEQALVKQPL